LNSSQALNDPSREALAEVIEGEALVPGDTRYDEVRAVWNGRFDRRPALIACCISREDVASAVRFARAHELSVSVKGGGHDYAGNTVADGGLLIDLGAMCTVHVDRVARRATVQAGATWGDVDAATQAYGLATPAGTISNVGVAGFTLGGGAGWLTPKYGLAVDNLMAAEVVTADGDIVRASEEENADLLWALRGGGGNFGIVTSLEYALHPVGPDVYAGQVMYPVERAGELLRLFRDQMSDVSGDLAAFFFFLRIPPLEFFPEEHHGAIAVDFVLTWLGPIEEGEAALAPFRELGDPIFEMVGPQPYVALQQSFDAGMSAKGNRWYSRFHYLDELSDAAIDAITGGLDPFPGEFTTVYLAKEGGAVSRVPSEATAFPHRGAEYSIHIFPGWIDSGSDGAVMNWAKSFSHTIASHAGDGVYVNMLAEDEVERIGRAYGENFERLRSLKAKWDPENVFRMNHNIAPEGD